MQLPLEIRMLVYVVYEKALVATGLTDLGPCSRASNKWEPHMTAMVTMIFGLEKQRGEAVDQGIEALFSLSLPF